MGSLEFLVRMGNKLCPDPVLPAARGTSSYCSTHTRLEDYRYNQPPTLPVPSPDECALLPNGCRIVRLGRSTNARKDSTFPQKFHKLNLCHADQIYVDRVFQSHNVQYIPLPPYRLDPAGVGHCNCPFCCISQEEIHENNCRTFLFVLTARTVDGWENINGGLT